MIVTPPFNENKLNSLWSNIALLEFRRQLVGAIAVEKMVDGVVDEYEDETGVDTSGSTNESYDSTNDLYSPLGIDTATKLLLHFDGANNSTTFTDAAGKTVNANGDAKISTAQSKFGGASGIFDGNGDFLTIANNADFDFGSGDFTIEMFVRFSSLANTQNLIGKWLDSAAPRSFIIFWNNGNVLYFKYSTDGTTQLQFTFEWTPTVDTWHHVAISRNGANLRAFIDGVQIGGTENIGASTLYTANEPLYIAARHTGATADLPLNGYLDELRISKGVARYTANFTAPTVAFPNYTNMSLVSNAFTAAAQASKGRIFLFQEDVDAITLNTDLLAYVSRDNGTTWTLATLVNLGVYDTSKNILGALVDISAQPAGTAMKYKLETANNKNLKIHGTGLLWQ